MTIQPAFSLLCNSNDFRAVFGLTKYRHSNELCGITCCLKSGQDQADDMVNVGDFGITLIYQLDLQISPSKDKTFYWLVR